jgi:CubicO group peptidase (beta-lactamase class C family)
VTKRVSILIPATALLLQVVAGVPALAAQQRGPSLLARNLDGFLRPLAARGDFAGTVLVARHDSILYERSFGLANIELGVPNTNDTRYRIHSITKQFTATAVLALVQRGQLDLAKSARDYLPELPVSWNDVTVQQLLTHTSGVPQAEEKWFESYRDHDVHNELGNLKLVAPLLANDTLIVKPGTAFGYNNFGYDLLACIVERVSGENFADFVHEAVFVRAGMADAGFDRKGNVGDGMYVASIAVPRLASGYNGPPTQLQVAFPYMFASAGAGGMYATARDLFNYDRALYRGTVIPASMLDANLTRAFSVSPKSAYGYGWIVRRPSDGVYYLQHSGGNNGYNADYARYPAEHVAIIVLSNRGATDAEGVGKEIQKMLFGGKYE